MVEGREIELYGDGSSARDYTYVDDIVEGVIRAADRVRGFRIWNLGGSHPASLADLVGRLAAALGVEAKIKRLPAQPGDVERTWADISRAARDLDWSPQVDLDRGLARFVRWLREARSQASGAPP
jgi:UDP-glucuronate 4-epimerase